MLWFLVIAAMSTVLSSATSAPAATVDRNARALARRDGRVRVIVELASPPAVDRAPSLGGRSAEVASVRARVLRAMSPRAVEVIREFSVIPVFAATVTADGLAQLERHPDVLRVDADAQGGGGGAGNVAQIRADRVHARGLDGAGSVIAVLDTGVDASHPDVQDALAHEECFCVDGCCPAGGTRQSGSGSAASIHWHGPHVTGVALSRGRVSPIGAAPGAQLVAVRVLGDDNRGSLIDWVAGLDWIVAHRPDVRVVNMSLVSDTLFSGNCDNDNAFNRSLARLIDLLYRRGTLVIAAAGNRGRHDALTSPACVSGSLAVGAVGADDEVAAFSNSGPELDLLAPGVGIVSDAPGGDVATRSGTSIAAPHVAGVAALLLTARPGASAGEIDALLRDTGVPITDPRNGLAVPRIDAMAAMQVIFRQGETLRGGGSRGSDCLLQWQFLPPDIARDGPRPLAVCADNDPSCDADGVEGQCTFLLSLCFNLRDPRLPDCRVDEPLVSYDLTWPPRSAPEGSIERVNVDNLRQALPAFPLQGSNVCSVAFPFVVPRGPGADRHGVGAIRFAVETATRRDFDRVALMCTSGE